jgi:nucleoside 2-deoxyribosyltransferase
MKLSNFHVNGSAPRVYLSGPMSGIEEFNYPAFKTAAADLRARGYKVVSPAELDEEQHGGPPDPSTVTPEAYVEYLSRDLEHVLEVDAVVALAGWEKSRGAKLECYVAAGLDKPVFSYATGDQISFDQIEAPRRRDENILEEANRIVGGDRGEDYGHPAEDFGRTAKIVSAILGIDVRTDQIPLLMIAVKLSRHTNKPQRDNLTDIAGYARTAEMVAEREGGYFRR